jgi:hypothetical protein
MLSGVRVVQVITEPTGGGAELLVRELDKGLLAEGVDSGVIFLANPKSVTLGRGEQSLPLRQPRSPLAILELRKALASMRKLSPNLLVHSHLSWPLYITPVAAIGMNIPICYTEHSTMNRRRSIELLKYVEPALYGRYARVFSISDAVSDSLQAWVGDKAAPMRTEVIQNGSRLLAYKGDRIIGDRIRLVSVGSLNQRKGFEWSVRAVATLRDIVSSYTIVGEGPDRALLEALIGELSLGDIVRLVGWADDPTPYYHAADALVAPSLWEGFSLVCVEGMSTGLPVIASDVPGMGDLLRDTGVATLVPAADANALASAVRGLRQSLVSGNLYSQAARRTAEAYSMERMVSRYISSYGEISAEWFGT